MSILLRLLSTNPRLELPMRPMQPMREPHLKPLFIACCGKVIHPLVGQARAPSLQQWDASKVR